MYTRSQLITFLIDEYGCDDSTSTETAADRFLKSIESGTNVDITSVVLAEGEYGDTIVEGNIEEDAEHTYSKQTYWNEEVLDDMIGHGPQQEEVKDIAEEWKM